MTPLWTSAAAAQATKGQAVGDWQVNGVSIDTRTLQAGDLFVALKAARDGHDFVAQALAKGAGAALVTHRPAGVAEDAPLLIVDDVQTALEDLGRAGRARSKARVVAVTGSVGKTSTKEMLRAALGGQGKTHAAEASYNNHWGVPLTLARLPEDADYAVIEIGMNHPGEIAPLAKMARPHVVMVTIVAPAHLEAFADIGGLAGIAAEKAAICEGLQPNGVAVMNGDLETSPILFAAAEKAGAQLIGFGMNEGNHHRALDVRVGFGATVAQAMAGDVPILLKVATEGRHFALNALGCVAAVTALGGDRALALLGLADWAPPQGRGTREIVVIDPYEDGMALQLIDDAFNANPASLSASLEVLAASLPGEVIGRFGKGRRIAVLGDMLELGPDEMALHAAIAQDPAIAALAQIHCVGPRMKALWEALPDDKRGRWVENADALIPEVSRLVEAGDIVLVKGSKGSYVSRIVDAIRKLGHRDATLTVEE